MVLRRRAAAEAGSLRDEEVDYMASPAIDDCSNRPPVDEVKPAADQREALRRQVDDWWGNVPPCR